MSELDPRATLRTWMREVMEAKGWSARHWAEKAGTSSSNITRFLADDDASCPSLQTIVKLASVSGSTPNCEIIVTAHRPRGVDRIEITLPEPVRELIAKLIRTGLYGDTEAEAIVTLATDQVKFLCGQAGYEGLLLPNSNVSDIIRAVDERLAAIDERLAEDKVR